MYPLRKQYELITTKSKEEIFAIVREKIASQKRKNNFFGLELVNYKNFKLSENLIEIESWPMTRVNPYEGVGTIIFEVDQKENCTNIKCTIEPYSKYALFVSSCFSLFILFLATTFLLIAFHDFLLTAMIIIAVICAFIVGTMYLTLLYYRNVLQTYSETVLNDLDIQYTKALD